MAMKLCVGDVEMEIWGRGDGDVGMRMQRCWGRDVRIGIWGPGTVILGANERSACVSLGGSEKEKQSTALGAGQNLSVCLA